MSCISVEREQLHQKRSEKKGLVINSCMIQHKLLFKSNCNDVDAKEQFIHCNIYWAFSFGNSEGTSESSILKDRNSSQNDSEWHCDSGETVDKIIYIEIS